jgi:DNA-binding IclR family transcriptional regulator
VANALRVLEYLVEVGEAGVTEAGRELDLSVATAHRMLNALVVAGYAEHDTRNRRYRPGIKVVTLANRVGGRLSLRQLARAHLVRLAHGARETVNLGALRGAEVLYLDRVLSERPLHIEVTIGSVVPAYRTAMGKALLAQLAPESLQAQLRMAPTAGPDNRDVSSLDLAGLRNELQLVRAQGFAEDRGEFMPDVSCAGAALIDASGAAIAAVSLSAPTSRYVQRREELIALVTETVGNLNAELRSLGGAVFDL